MAYSFGSAKDVTLDAAASFGLILQAAGYTKEASAGLSTQLVKVADDTKSLYNVPLDQVLEKIRAGLVGQARPLREYGVLLSAAAVDHELLSRGLKKTEGHFSEQEKVMARVKLITEGLKHTQGDHMKTMGEYANQVDMLKGRMQNFQAGIGAGVAAAEAKFLVNVEEKGILGALGSHFSEAWTQLTGGGDTSFQRGADIAAGLQIGGIVFPKAGEPGGPELPKKADYATEMLAREFEDEMEAIDDMEYAAKNRRSMGEIRFLAEYMNFDTMKPEERKKEAKDELKFLFDFLDFDIPAKKREKIEKEQEFRAESVGVAEFASRLRMEQGGGGVPEKQLTELQQIRKTEMEAAKSLAKLAERGFPAVLG